MGGIRNRLEAVAVGVVVTVLGSWGVREVTPELAAEIHRWVGHTLELVVLIGTAALHRSVRGRGVGRTPAPAAGGAGGWSARVVIRLERGRRG